MNYKYFGNSLDLFKFDVLTYITLGDNAELFYVTMLTEPEKKPLDPKYKLYQVGTKNEVLHDFLLDAGFSDSKLDVKDICSYFEAKKISHKIILEKNYGNQNHISFERISYFNNEIRTQYFEQAITSYKTQKNKTLVFLDPDVGIDLNIVRRVRSKKNLYLNKEEISTFKNELKENDYICYFQHLGNHNYDITQRVEDLKNIFGNYVLLIGYRRTLASLVFIFNSENEYVDKQQKLKNYILYNEDIKNKITLL